MALVKKPTETVRCTIRLGQPVNELLDDYCPFPDCTANFTLRETLRRDPGFKKWKPACNGAGNATAGPQKAL